MLYIRSDSKVLRFASHKNVKLYINRKNPRKLAWTVFARRANKKGVTAEEARKRSRKTVKAQRGVVGADLASILAKRTQKVRRRRSSAWLIGAARGPRGAAEGRARRREGAQGGAGDQAGVDEEGPRVALGHHR